MPNKIISNSMPTTNAMLTAVPPVTMADVVSQIKQLKNAVERLQGISSSDSELSTNQNFQTQLEDIQDKIQKLSAADEKTVTKEGSDYATLNNRIGQFQRLAVHLLTGNLGDKMGDKFVNNIQSLKSELNTAYQIQQSVIDDQTCINIVADIFADSKIVNTEAKVVVVCAFARKLLDEDATHYATRAVLMFISIPDYATTAGILTPNTSQILRDTAAALLALPSLLVPMQKTLLNLQDTAQSGIWFGEILYRSITGSSSDEVLAQAFGRSTLGIPDGVPIWAVERAFGRYGIPDFASFQGDTFSSWPGDYLGHSFEVNLQSTSTKSITIGVTCPVAVERPTNALKYTDNGWKPVSSGDVIDKDLKNVSGLYFYQVASGCNSLKLSTNYRESPFSVKFYEQLTPS